MDTSPQEHDSGNTPSSQPQTPDLSQVNFGHTSANAHRLADNPLLQSLTPVPYEKIEARHFQPAIGELINHEQAKLDKIINESGKRTYENTILALDSLGEKLGKVYGIAAHLKSVDGTDEINDAFAAVQPEISKFFSSITLSAPLWKAISDYAATPEASQLTGNAKRLLEKTLNSFRKNGAELDQADKERVADINLELSSLSTQFGQNVTKSRAAFEHVVTDPAELSGLPQEDIDAAKKSAHDSGIQQGWRFTLDAPSLIAVMQYADNAQFRETLFRASATTASTGELDNSAIAQRILELRQEKATILGFANFADYQLSERMAGSGQAAKDFLESIHQAARPAFLKENKELRAFKQAVENDPQATLDPWDVAYYSEKLRQRDYNFDSKELQKYFNANQVIAGAFGIFEQLYGIELTERTDLPKWHPNVKTFEIHDIDGAKLGTLAIDLFPRDEKQGGAWHNNLDASYAELYDGIIVCNMTPPNAKGEALLSHREVETVFHEAGHFIHRMFTDVEEGGLSGVPWDFVELPSQIMENWTWDKKVLSTFGFDQSGAGIPDSLYDKAVQAKNFRSASFIMRQLSFGLLDLKIHTEYDPACDGSLAEYSRRERAPFSPTEILPEDSFLNSFSHIFAGGYAAAYYSYMWASALEAMVFEEKFSGKLFDQTTGIEFRHEVLAKGNTEDTMPMINRYLEKPDNTPIDPNPYLRREGLLP